MILSEMAGAARDLGEAIIINPNNEDEIVEAIEEALTMSEEEQLEKNRAMQARLQDYNVKRWAERFVDTLLYIKEVQKKMNVNRLTHEMGLELVSNYQKSSRRLMLLDHDGTLIPFFERPDEDVFGVLPEEAYSIRVGLNPSKAKFNVRSTDEVRRVLSEFGN